MRGTSKIGTSLARRPSLGSMSLGTASRLSRRARPGARGAHETRRTTYDHARQHDRSNLPGKPPVVDVATWPTAREELLVHEKAHAREGDTITAAGDDCRSSISTALSGHRRRRVGPVPRPVPIATAVVYHSMSYDDTPPQGQCEGSTFNVWHIDDAVYLDARGVSFTVLTSGSWDEVAPYVGSSVTPSPGIGTGVEAPSRARRGTSSVTFRDSVTCS